MDRVETTALIVAEADAICADLREWNTARAHAIADRVQRIKRLAGVANAQAHEGELSMMLKRQAD